MQLTLSSILSIKLTAGVIDSYWVADTELLISELRPYVTISSTSRIMTTRIIADHFNNPYILRIKEIQDQLAHPIDSICHITSSTLSNPTHDLNMSWRLSKDNCNKGLR